MRSHSLGCGCYLLEFGRCAGAVGSYRAGWSLAYPEAWAFTGLSATMIHMIDSYQR